MACKMLLIGEAHGAEEEEYSAHDGKPCAFVGEAGKLLFDILGSAAPHIAPELHIEATELARRRSPRWIEPRDEWLDAAGIHLTNVLNFRPPDNMLSAVCIPRDELPADYPEFMRLPITRHPRALYLHPSHEPQLDRLYSEICDLSPNLIVALGNTACWATIRATNIGSIRGTITQYYSGPISRKVLPIYHPAALLHSSMKGALSKPVAIADFIKAFRECEYPEIRRPVRWVTVNPTIEECECWCTKARALCAQGKIEWLSCDIETAHRMIKCISFAFNSCEALVIPFWPDECASYWPDVATEMRAWDCVTRLLTLPCPKLGQNFLYDIQYLMEAPLGAPIYNPEPEDTMLLWHSFWPELPKALGFIASICTNEVAWKLMRRRRPDTEKRDE